MITIYKIVNMENGMMYIGKTKRSLRERWGQHKSDAKKKWACFKLQNAIKEYGAECFRIMPIDYAETEADANEKETMWIDFYNSIEKGYNSARGGKDSGARKKVKAVESGLVFDSMIEAGQHFGLSKGRVSQVVDKKHLTAGGQHWISV